LCGILIPNRKKQYFHADSSWADFIKSAHEETAILFCVIRPNYWKSN
jgi:hypothetical protein